MHYCHHSIRFCSSWY